MNFLHSVLSRWLPNRRDHGRLKRLGVTLLAYPVFPSQPGHTPSFSA